MSGIFNYITPVKNWCYKVLPLVYDDSLSYYEFLCKVVAKLNEVIKSVDSIPEYIASLLTDEKLLEIVSTVMDELREQIASANEGTSTTCTEDRTTGELVWLNGKLASILRNMYAGDRYVEGSNFEYITIEEYINDINNTLVEDINSRIADVNARIDGVDTRIDGVDERINGVDTRLDGVDTTISNLKIPVYKDIDSMIASNLEEGDKCITLLNGCAVNWIISSSGTASEYCKEMTNGNFATIKLGEVNVRGLLTNVNADCTSLCNTLLANGYDLYFDKGTFYCNLNVTRKGASIRGVNNTDACLEPATNAPIITVNGELISVSDLRMQNIIHFATWGNACGIKTPSDGQLVRCRFKNIMMEDTMGGVWCQSGCLWNTFENVRVYGCVGIAFRFEAEGSGKQINNNNFIACEVTRCTRHGYYFYDPQYLSWGNVLNGCTCEATGTAVGTYTPTGTDSAIFSTVQLSINDCYFEANAGKNLLQSWYRLKVIGCSFINITIPFFMLGGAYDMTVFLYNNGHQCTGSLFDTGSGTTMTSFAGNVGIPAA